MLPLHPTERKENHDGRIQRSKVVKFLPLVDCFSASNFTVRFDRRLGSGCFGDVFACGFGYKKKIQCVIKIAKKGGELDLVLEGRVLQKLVDDPADWRQKFFAFPFGYSEKHKGLVSERFFGFSVRQHASQKMENDWVTRLIEITEALSFMHERQVLHLDLHSSNVLFSKDSSKIIDFGKATLSSFPITFMLDSDERMEYNQKYKQIEFELRNEKNVQTKECSDIFSFGVLIYFIGNSCVVSDALKKSFTDLSSRCCAPRAIRSSLVLVLMDLQEIKSA